MIGHRREALLFQPSSGIADLLARQAINYTRIALVLTAQKAQQLLTRILLLSNAVLNVGTIETADEMSRVHQP